VGLDVQSGLLGIEDGLEQRALPVPVAGGLWLFGSAPASSENQLPEKGPLLLDGPKPGAAAEHPGQQAGVVCWYDTGTHYFLGVAAENQVIVSTSDEGEYAQLNTGITAGDLVHLRATIDHERLQFAVAPDGETWQPVGPELDMTKLSDDCGSSLRFTGAFVGLAAHDPVTGTLPADFAYFEYRTG
jgi:hypothetical protein